MKEREGAELRVALAFCSGLGNSNRGAFCPLGKEMLHGSLCGGQEACFGQVEYGVSQGYREMKILNGQFKR